MKFTLLALMFSVLLQGGRSSPKDLLSVQRPLTSAEIDTVVSGIRQALAGRTIRLWQERQPDREITGVPARRCNGVQATGEMVIEFRSAAIRPLLNSTTQMWTAAARESGPRDIALVRPLEMLRTTASLTSGETRFLGNRGARAIVSPLSNVDGPMATVGATNLDPIEALRDE
jgi:hypothetical protein